MKGTSGYYPAWACASRGYAICVGIHMYIYRINNGNPATLYALSNSSMGGA